MDVLREKINTVQRDIKEIKGGVDRIDEGQRQLATDFKVSCEQNQYRDERLDKHEDRIQAIEEAIKPMIFAYKILAWVGTLLGGSLFVLCRNVRTSST